MKIADHGILYQKTNLAQASKRDMMHLQSKTMENLQNLDTLRRNQDIVAISSGTQDEENAGTYSLKVGELKLYNSEDMYDMFGAEVYEANMGKLGEMVLAKQRRQQEYLDNLTSEDTYRDYNSSLKTSDEWYCVNTYNSFDSIEALLDVNGRQSALDAEYAKLLKEIGDKYTGKLAKTFLEGLERAYEENKNKINDEYNAALIMKAETEARDKELARLSREYNNAREEFLATNNKAGQVEFVSYLRENRPDLFKYYLSSALYNGDTFTHILYGNNHLAGLPGNFTLDDYIDIMGEEGKRKLEHALRIRSEEYLNTLQPHIQLMLRYQVARETQTEKILAGLSSNPSMSLDAQLLYQKRENTKWVESMRANDLDLFKYYLLNHRDAIEAGTPERAWLPSDFTMDDYHSYIDKDWGNWARGIIMIGPDQLQKCPI